MNWAMPSGFAWLIWAMLGLVPNLESATFHVWQGSPNPTVPHTNWATAAHLIQEAVDAAGAADTVLVTNGIYATGERLEGGTMNRVVLTKALVVRSVNGPEVTIIEGAGPRGSNAVRCAYVGGGAVLSGFTLTNGHTQAGVPSSADRTGGGVYSEPAGIVTNCFIIDNFAGSGGGVNGGRVYNCLLARNWAGGFGGGANQAILHNCALTANEAQFGGGAYWSTLQQCTVTTNRAMYQGGGVDRSELQNCVVYFNACFQGANYFNSILGYSCTTPLAAGAGNMDDEPRLASATHLSIHSPCIGVGNPAFARGVDLDGDSWGDPPCMGADQVVSPAGGPLQVRIEAAYTRAAVGFSIGLIGHLQGRVMDSTWDFGDGTTVSHQPFLSHTWRAPGMYRITLTGYNDDYPGGIVATALVEVVEQPVSYVNAANPTPAFPFTSWETAAVTIQDAIGAGTVAGRLVRVHDGLYQMREVVAGGALPNRVALTNAVVVQSVNGPEVTIIQGKGPKGATAVRCAYVGNDAVLSGFTLTNGHSFTTGDYADQRGAGVYSGWWGLVTNCVIIGNQAWNRAGGAYGGQLKNCVLAANKAGDGGGVALANLQGCLLVRNSASSSGGAYVCLLRDCVLTGNTGYYTGGGCSRCTLYNCLLTDNYTEDDWAGGADVSTLYGCTLTRNTAGFSGGATYLGSLYNCIVYGNSAPRNPNHSDSTLYYCCTLPLPTLGFGNITNEPSFVNPAAGDYRLSYGSPCIDAGTDLRSLVANDLDGAPRPLDGDGDGIAAFDLGAYEFDLRTLVPADWLLRYGLDPSDPDVLVKNPDHDPPTTFQEWVADTDPTNSHSYFRLDHLEHAPEGGATTVYFFSSSNRQYSLFKTDALFGDHEEETSWMPVADQTNRPGLGGIDSLTDILTAPRAFYKVEAALPPPP